MKKGKILRTIVLMFAFTQVLLVGEDNTGGGGGGGVYNNIEESITQ